MCSFFLWPEYSTCKVNLYIERKIPHIICIHCASYSLYEIIPIINSLYVLIKIPSGFISLRSSLAQGVSANGTRVHCASATVLCEAAPLVRLAGAARSVQVLLAAAAARGAEPAEAHRAAEGESERDDLAARLPANADRDARRGAARDARV